ncbi:hypothetical protein SPSIL_029370 [Sporomusa silvacetica DSM 10669]|uniref:Uncharacterized protein n=1 Tax=Sporomusa silvacetica DSM 10669 TaxID=1123289 RepID=A0ABZ3IMS4_9FIRM|nr:hypothetical protein [Sporomusa silvacetica]OZC15713.1 hypothetical protein SPSIL_40430 [Sporomusa silvacetica DSM 10669]
MSTYRWILKESWPVEQGQRLIFQDSPRNTHIVDTTITKNIDEVINKVETERWSLNELLLFLNQYSNT